MTGGESLFAALFILSFSLGHFIDTVVMLIRVIRIKNDPVFTLGIVMELRYDDEELASPRRIIRYQANNGKAYDIATSSGSVFSKNSLGSQVKVIYWQKNPSLAYVPGDIKTSIVIFSLIIVPAVALASIFLLYTFYTWFIE